MLEEKGIEHYTGKLDLDSKTVFLQEEARRFTTLVHCKSVQFQIRNVIQDKMGRNRMIHTPLEYETCRSNVDDLGIVIVDWIQI